MNVDVEIPRTQGRVNNSVRYQRGYSINCDIYHMCFVISCMINVVRTEIPIATITGSRIFCRIAETAA